MFICLHLCWCFPPSHFSLSYWRTSVRSLCRQSQQSILPSDTQTNTNTHCGHRVDVSCIQTPLLFFLAQACVKPEGKGHRQKNTTGDFQQLNRSVQPREHRVKCKKNNNMKMWEWMHVREWKDSWICRSAAEETEQKKCAFLYRRGVTH